MININHKQGISIPPSGVRGLLFLLLISISSFAQTPQTITFPDIPVKGYGDASYTLNATSSSGLAVTYVSSNTTVATVSGSTVTIKTSGYSVISAYQNGNGTYAAAIPVPQLLVVCPKATLTVTADNKTITAGTTTPVLTYTTTGFKLSQTSSVITGTPVFQSPGSSLSAGTYPIVINKGTISATNYEFMMVDGTLTVNSGTATPVVNTEDSIIKIFPNPASNYFIVENADNEIIEIFNLLGNVILNTKPVGNSFRLNVSNLATGTYILRINKNNTLTNKKLVINH
jgi:hypothetical protein